MRLWLRTAISGAGVPSTAPERDPIDGEAGMADPLNAGNRALAR